MGNGAGAAVLTKRAVKAAAEPIQHRQLQETAQKA